MGKLKPIKTLDQAILSINQISNLTEPVGFDPVLSKISQKSLLMMFENDIALSMKAIKFNSSTNNQKLLNMDLFLTAWKKYGSCLPPLLYATRLIESGEELIQCKGFHNLANSHCFSKLLEINNHAEGIHMARLIVRAKYGRAMANYIQILSMDPFLRSPVGDELVDGILSELLKIMDECSKEEGLAGLILTGSYHVRNICNHLIEKKSYSLVLYDFYLIKKSAEYLSNSVKYLNENIELTGGEFIPWLVDNVKATYDAFFNLSMIEDANEIVVSTIARIKLIEQLEKEAKYTEILPNDIQENINAGLYEMNLLLFGCEVRSMTSVIYRGTAQSSTYFNLGKDDNDGAETETLLKTQSSISKRKSSKQLIQILKEQVDRLCEASTSKALYKIKPGAYGSTFQENAKYNQEIKKMTDSYIEENDIQIENLEKMVDQEESVTVCTEKKLEHEVSQKKQSKKEKQIADDIKVQKNEFKRLISRLQMFSDDRGKLAAINAALLSLGLNGNSLHTYPKCTVPELQKMIQRFISFGVFLLASPGSLDGHITIRKMIEVQEGKQTEIQKIPQFVDLGRFELDDVINFSRFLYVKEYWGPYLRIALNNELLQQSGFGSFKNEMALRCRHIKFDTSFHADRMVGFDYSKEDISKSLFEIQKKRQKVGKYVEKSIIAFIQEAYTCLSDEINRHINENLLIDTSYILWKYVEPYFLDLDAKNPDNSLFFEEIVIATVYAAYVISSQIYNSSNLFVTIGSAYAQYLEVNSHFKESIDILLNAIKHLKMLKTRLGENCSPFINSLLEEKSIDCKTQGNMLVKLLACDHVDLLESYYRCYIKLHHAKTVDDVKTREEQHFRLTQKKIKIDPSFKESDLDEFMKLLCGDSQSHRAVFLLVFSCDALHYDIEIRKKCIILAHKYLKQAVDYEKYLKEISIAKENTNLSLEFRSHDCVAVRVSATESGLFARLFCNLNSVNKMVSIKNSKFAGTGESLTLGPKKEAIIFISGLEKCTLYEISGNLEDSEGKKLIQLPRIKIITGSMLPLILCWEKFSIIAPQLGYLNLGLNGLKVLWSYFVDSPSMDNLSIKNALPIKPPLLKDDHITRENHNLLTNFIKVIQSLNEEEYHPILKTYLDDLSDNSLFHSLIDFRFKAVTRLLVALNLSKITENRPLEMKSAIMCLNHTISIIRTNPQNSGTISVLSLIHESLMRSIYTLKNNRTQGIIEYLIPTTYYLVKHFTNLKMFEQILKTCSETLNTIHRHCVVGDLKVKLLMDERFSKTGVAPDSKLKNLNSSQEFVHHEYFATSGRWNTGYTLEKTAIDDFCEYLELQIVTSCYKLPLYLESSLVNDALKKELARRSLDSQPSIKEIRILFENCQSPDVVFHEILKLRKNSRFIEIASMIARWGISIGNFEQASKICADIEDWSSKRNFILSTRNLSPEEAQKWEALVKKKKNLLKADRKPETEYNIEKRGRTLDRPDHASTSVNSMRMKKGTKTLQGKKAISGDRDWASSRDINETSVSRDLNTSQKPSSPQRGSSEKRVQESAGAGRDSPNGHIAYLRKKLNKRQQYFDGLTPDMKSKFEKAAKVLDKQLSYLWLKSRIRKRLRLILTYEAPARIDIAFLHAESMLGILKKELNQRGLIKKEALDVCSILQSQTSVPGNWGMEEIEKNLAFPSQLLNHVKDIFQYLSTGIKLAARYGLWIKLFSGIQQMFDTYKYLVEPGAFDTAIWKDRLSEIFYYAADDISDCFQTVTFSAEDSLKPYISSLKHCLLPDHAKTFPAVSREDIFDHSWNILYKDIHGVIRTEGINLSDTIKFLQFSLEIMQKAKKVDRYRLLLERLNNIFPESDIFLAQSASNMEDERSSHKLLNAAKCTIINHRITLYGAAWRKAEEEGCLANVLIALHELGNTLYEAKDIKGAVSKWMACISIVFGRENNLKNWPLTFSFNFTDDRSSELLKTAIEILKITKNAKLSILMGLIISKLSHYGYARNEGFQSHLNLFAVSCLLAPFVIIPPRASTHLDFWSYESNAVREVLGNFSSKYGYHIGAMLNDVLWMINHSISSRTPDLVPPLVCFINHITQCGSFSSTITKCAQFEALQLFKMPDIAFTTILDMRTGTEFSSLSFAEIFRAKGGISGFLDSNVSEAAKGIFSQELISIAKTKFVIDSWLYKERSQSGISEAMAFVLEQRKKVYSLKLQAVALDRLFYDRVEIWWNILLGDLSFLARNIGLSIKWYFTAMEALQSYSADGKTLGPIEYGFMSITNLRFLIFQKTILSFIALKHFDVANNIARTARKESESLGMKLQSILFYSLETASTLENIIPILTQDIKAVEYMHMHNFETISGAFEIMIDCAFNGLSAKNFNYDPFNEFYSISKKFTYLKEDLLRIKIKHFLFLRLTSDLQSIQPLFAEIHDLFTSSSCSPEITRNYILLKARNWIDLAQSQKQPDLANLVEAKQIMIDFVSKLVAEHTFAYAQIRESLLLLASIELLQNGEPAKWMYLATRLTMLRNHHKLQKKLSFNLNIDNLPKELLYDLELFNYKNQITANGLNLPYPIETDKLENVLKFSDPLLALPETLVSEEDIFEIVTILEDELLNPYKPLNDPWKNACQERLTQFLSLSDTDYQWDIVPSNFEISIPQNMHCIQWLETRQPGHLRASNQANLYKLYFYTDEELFTSHSLVPKSELDSLVQKAESLLLNLKRSYQIPDENFMKKATENWNSLLDKFTSFFETSTLNIKYLEPTIPLVECLIKCLTQGYGYGADLSPLCPDGESSKAFCEWLLTAVKRK